MNGEMNIVINEEFKTQLITGILSSPIIYIPHYHYNYVDTTLSVIFPSKTTNGEINGDRMSLGLCRDTVFEYDVNRGQLDFESKRRIAISTPLPLAAVLNNLLTRNEKDSDSPVVLNDCKILLLKNVGQLLNNDYSIQLLLQTFAEKYERREYDERTTIIIVDPMPVSLLPNALSDIITVISVPLPKLNDIQSMICDIEISDQYESTPGKKMGIRDDLCRNLQGLHYYEIEQVLRSILILSNGKLTERSIQYALEEKKQIVKKSGIIEVVDTDVSFDNIGGLDILKEDLRKVSIVYKNLSDVARYGIPLPKGVLIMGMPGCGKSLIAKAIAHEFGVSLLRLDISKLMGQYVGQSEENLRRALATAEAAHPCVLWIDEIEKAFHGANSTNGGDNDMLVMRMMGYFLTWMQERKTAVYIVATANDVMRPEFMRKGRFDEVYYVDFPNKEDAKEIFEKHLAQYRTMGLFRFDGFDINSINKVVKLMDGFAGSEIASIVCSVMSNKFNQLLEQRNKREQDLKEVIAKGLSNNNESIRNAVFVTFQDFESVIIDNKESVMSKQDNPAIEGIRKLKSQYKFKSASSNTSRDDKISKLREKERRLLSELEEYEISERIEMKEKALDEYKKRKK